MILMWILVSAQRYDMVNFEIKGEKRPATSTKNVDNMLFSERTQMEIGAFESPGHKKKK